MPHHLMFQQPGCVASALSSVYTYFGAHVPPPTYVEAWGERKRGNRGRRRERSLLFWGGWRGDGYAVEETGEEGVRGRRPWGEGATGCQATGDVSEVASRGFDVGGKKNRLPTVGRPPPPSGRREATGKGVPILLCNEIPTFTPNIEPSVRGEKFNTRNKGFEKS